MRSLKKNGLALILLLVLLLVCFAVGFAKVASASSPLASGAGILSPTNTTYSPGRLTLKTISVGLGGSSIYYTITYSLDGKPNVTVPLEIETHPRSFQITIRGSAPLPALSEGSHSITVYQRLDYNTTAPRTFWDSSTVYFTINDGNSPVIANVSVENRTYAQKTLPLNFTLDGPTSWMGYCVDNQANETIKGNTTITGLNVGPHTLKVFANDTAGNMGVSNTSNFTISQPIEDPPSVSNYSLDRTFLTAIVIVGVVVAVAALVYVWRKK